VIFLVCCPNMILVPSGWEVHRRILILMHILILMKNDFSFRNEYSFRMSMAEK